MSLTGGLVLPVAESGLNKVMELGQGPDLARPPGQVAHGVVGIGALFSARSSEYAALDRGGRLARLAQEMFQIPIVVPIMAITGGNGTLVISDPAGPYTGYYWSVRRLNAQGFTAGSVQTLRNPVTASSPGTVIGTPEQLPAFPTAGVNTFGRGEILLNPNDWLGWTATGITLAAGYAGVQIQGTADCFPTWLLPEYLM